MLSYDKPATVHHGSKAPYSAPTGAQRRIRPMSQPDRHVFVVYGPAGCGKSTMAQHIAERYGFDFVEGDELHPASNVAKMTAGIALTDADRWDWLIAIREKAVDRLNNGAKGVVVTCSALKQKYRDVIRIASINEHRVHVNFLFLMADQQTLIKRVSKRSVETGHFMGSHMVASQFQDLELPDPKREKDITTIDVTGPLSENQRLADKAVEDILL